MAKKAKNRKYKNADDFDVFAGGKQSKTGKKDEAPLDFETDTAAELNDLQKAFNDAAQRENQRYWDAVDSEYWFCVCFQTRDQKEEFLKLLGIFDIGDKYLDGMKVAKRLKLELKSRIPPIHRLKDDDKGLADLAMEI